MACSQPSGYVSDNTDCDDNEVLSNPGETEVCDSLDNNCDGVTDEDSAADALTWYADSDGDAYGNLAASVLACTQPSGYVADATDCNDAEVLAYAGASEVCDGVDNDCDPATDENTVSGTTWYEDGDGDGHGDPEVYETSCTAPPSYVSNSDDCHDGWSSVYPGATEVCDTADNDCDGLFDEAGAIGEITWYPDNDHDSYGTETGAVVACYEPVDGSYISVRPTDCDDNEPLANPGLSEVCGDFIDNNCDGSVDESGGTGDIAWYTDNDGDGYGDAAASPTLSCSQPSGSVADNTDCDDNDPLTNPGETEVCNDLIDNNCDGTDNGCSLSGTIGLADADAKLIGEMSSDYAGSVSSAGDVDADGNDDILVGAPYNDAGGTLAGAAYLVYGSVSGTMSLSSADAKLTGEAAGDAVDWSISDAGDVDGDGADDILVGASGNDTGGNYAGAAYLVLGPVSGTNSLSTADAKLTGEATFDLAGYSVSSTGDVNGDGVDDIVVGAPGDYAEGKTGAAYLVLGPVSGTNSLSIANAKLTGEAADYQAGNSVSGAGDVDGDGIDDILVGSHNNDGGAGAAYLVLGPVSGTSSLSTADAKLTGEAVLDHAGVSVSGTGDVDGDGLSDILVGAPNYIAMSTSGGMAYLVLGPVSGTNSLSTADAKLTGEVVGDWAGRSVSGAGDVDGDGFSDILVGARGNDAGGTSAGAAYLVYGSIIGTTSLSSADAKLTGEVAGDVAGSSVSGAGDVDGDGVDDILVGALGNDAGGSSAGAAYLLYGGGM